MKLRISPFRRGAPLYPIERITLGQAWAQILKENSGIKCPHGCNGCSVRVFGLVSHLMEKHNYTEEKAWKKARKSI